MKSPRLCTKCKTYNANETSKSHVGRDKWKIYLECSNCNYIDAITEVTTKKNSQEEYFITPDLWWEQIPRESDSISKKSSGRKVVDKSKTDFWHENPNRQLEIADENPNRQQAADRYRHPTNADKYLTNRKKCDKMK